MREGQMVLIEDKFFGTILEIIEKNITIRSVRRAVPNRDVGDPIRRYLGVPDAEFRWYAEDCERSMARAEAGPIRVYKKMPAFLEEGNLNYRPPLFLMTTIGGRTYIEW